MENIIVGLEVKIYISIYVLLFLVFHFQKRKYPPNSLLPVSFNWVICELLFSGFDSYLIHEEETRDQNVGWAGEMKPGLLFIHLVFYTVPTFPLLVFNGKSEKEGSISNK